MIARYLSNILGFFCPTCFSSYLQTPSVSTLNNSSEKHVHNPPHYTGSQQNSKIQIWPLLTLHHITGTLQGCVMSGSLKVKKPLWVQRSNQSPSTPVYPVKLGLLAACIWIATSLLSFTARELWHKPTWIFSSFLVTYSRMTKFWLHLRKIHAVKS